MGITAPSGTIRWDLLGTPDELVQAGAVVAAPGAALRCISAQEAMLRVEPYLHDYGITRVAHLTRLDCIGIPVHTAHKPAGTSLSNGSGKGVEPESSRIGAIMEALEQSYWEGADIPRIKASANELVRDGIVHAAAEQLPMYRANLWNANLTIEWTPTTDLVSGQTVLVPADLVSLPQYRSTTRTAVTHVCSSNGLASGNNVIEALLSGLTEVMERDAIAMKAAKSVRGVAPIELDLDLLRAEMGEPYSGLLDKLHAASVGLTVYDATGEAQLPTYKCMIWESGEGGAGLFTGYGSNLKPSIALVRALTEAVQARALIIAGARDDQYRCGRDAARLMSRQSYGNYGAADAIPTQYPDQSTGSMITDIELLVDKLRLQGSPQILVHRYTEPTDPAQVIRIIIPNLEGYLFDHYQAGPRAQAAINKKKLAATA